TFTANYAEDVLDDPEVDDTPNTPGDGIPDKYQIKVNYAVENGTIDMTEAVVTKFDAKGTPAADGTATLGASHIPTPAANAGYCEDIPFWANNDEPYEGLEVEDKQLFTARYAEDVLDDPTIDDTPGVPGDGMPDKYQAVVTFRVVNGIFERIYGMEGTEGIEGIEGVEGEEFIEEYDLTIIRTVVTLYYPEEVLGISLYRSSAPLGHVPGTALLDAIQIPNPVPNPGYQGGKWDITPTTSYIIKGDMTFTYTYDVIPAPVPPTPPGPPIVPPTEPEPTPVPVVPVVPGVAPVVVPEDETPAAPATEIDMTRVDELIAERGEYGLRGSYCVLHIFILLLAAVVEAFLLAKVKRDNKELEDELAEFEESGVNV
ncbi:MAG: hypothetical protein HUJ57_03575, partial [Erysipelotrichaceae bacterium]|nr:hypothetical protein [Erysipelotrichaceae bacterium]